MTIPHDDSWPFDCNVCEILASQLAAANAAVDEYAGLTDSYRMLAQVTLSALADITKDRDTIRRRYHEALDRTRDLPRQLDEARTERDRCLRRAA
jgi:hypothetical protein